MERVYILCYDESVLSVFGSLRSARDEAVARAKRLGHTIGDVPAWGMSVRADSSGWDHLLDTNGKSLPWNVAQYEVVRTPRI